MQTPHSSVPTISFREALWFWFKLGFISFGGPAGQIGIMHQALVVERRWLSDKRFLHALNYCMLLPGPEAQQLATYLGWLMHKTIGGVLAGALFVLPSLLLMIGLSWIYVSFSHAALVTAVFWGIKPAVIAIVLQAVHRIGSRTLRNRYLWSLAALSFSAIFFLQIPFPWIVLGAAICGAGLGRFIPHSVQLASTHHSASEQHQAALIDDHTPTPAHARFKFSRLVWVLIAGAVLWALPVFLLWLGFGPQNTLLQMSGFFSKAALMTFGGAYAVLPYVYQGAVETFQWLTPQQMIDGLALGESTPGPLIMVVSFVGYLGAYAKPVLSSEQGLLLSATLGAVVATWFTFLPSFIFILAGGPLVESTQHQLRLTAPLTGITAAVVGVMLNLALFFAYHVLWPQGWSANVDWLSALLTLASVMAVLRFKWSVLRLLGTSALVGAGMYLAGWAF